MDISDDLSLDYAALNRRWCLPTLSAVLDFTPWLAYPSPLVMPGPGLLDPIVTPSEGGHNLGGLRGTPLHNGSEL